MQIRRLATYAAQGQSIRARIKRKGICPRGAPLWTTAEDNAIRRFYPDYEAAARILTRRTLSAIRKRAFRLKIVRKSYRWTAAEVIRLKRIYPTGPREEILAAFPGADWQQITNMRKRLKIYRKRRPLKAIGCPITDEIRIRARELNLR